MAIKTIAQHKITKLIVILAVIIVGAMALISSRAATPTAATEAEDGTLSSAVSVVPGNNASGGEAVQFGAATSTSFNVQNFLALFTPGTAHEALPHGVPGNCAAPDPTCGAGHTDAWATKSTLSNLAPPDADSTWQDLWGQLYVKKDDDVRPANTRVEVANCQEWALPNSSNTWQDINDPVPTDFNSTAWQENFIAADKTNSAAEIKTNSSGNDYSFVTVEGDNAHFFNQNGAAGGNDIANVGSSYRAFVDACSARLILASPLVVPSAGDDRSDSSYILSIGSDWKPSTKRCGTGTGGAEECPGVGVGKFVIITNAWRRVVFSTMTSANLNSFPLPPAVAFQNPDGSYGGTAPN